MIVSTTPTITFLYLDKNNNGEFFKWRARDGFESFAGFGEDVGRGFASAASGELLIDGDTLFGADIPGDPFEGTLAELQEGTVEGISGKTPAALHVGVTTGGKGMDEVVIEGLRVQRG